MPRRGLPSEGVGELVDVLQRQQQRIRTLEIPTGEQLSRTLAKVQQLIADLPGMVSAAILALVNLTISGNLSVGGNVTAAGRGTFTTGITSTGVATTDLSAIAGSRQPVWQHIASGVLGYAPSTAEKKTNIADVPVDASSFLAVAPRVFQYKALIDVRDNPENPAYDPSIVVPFEPGFLAEELVEAGLGMFVIFAADGVTPAGIAYDMFAAIGFAVIGRDHERRIRDLEAAMSAQ